LTNSRVILYLLHFTVGLGSHIMTIIKLARKKCSSVC